MGFQQIYDLLTADIDYQPIITFLDTHLDKSKNVLDAGCGTGIFLLPLLDMSYQVTGIDMDEEALSRLKQKLDEKQIYAPLYCHDLRNPIYQSFDQIILMNDVVNYFKGIKGVFKHLKKALNPKGVIILDCYKYEYLQTMDGYIETDNEPINYTWKVKRKSNRLTHIIEADKQYVIDQTIHPLDYYIKAFETLGFKVEILEGPDERKHYLKASL